MAGRIIGPCCGRVRSGVAQVEGETLSLSKNEGDNHLHGGPHGAAEQRWTTEDRGPDHVTFTLRLPHGLDGYPGERQLTATYRVTEGALTLSLTGETDRPTWLGMTSHLYWDLTGRFDGSAMGQRLEIAARQVVMNDDHHLPVAVVPISGPFDFTAPVVPGDLMAKYPDDRQLAIARGYNNAFIFDDGLRRERGFSARLTDPGSNLSMTLDTDQASVVFYSGGFLGPDIHTVLGPASPGCALALEAQPVPDPFHLPGTAPEFTRPGQPWRREITWRFHREV